MNKYLKETVLLDFSHREIKRLFDARNWSEYQPAERINSIYTFVRDEILFGYNEKDDLPASRILSDGYGQCNTKGILLMALLRKAGIPCRMHGFTIDKALQKGAITGIWYALSPRSIIHSWVEVYYENVWYNLEGFIIDRPYLEKIQEKNAGVSAFCGYGIATGNLMKPQIDWNVNDTYIQKDGINADFGIFDSPDEFFGQHRQKLGKVKTLIFKRIVRNVMNNNVRRIRKG
jgi:hypothetical protein